MLDWLRPGDVLTVTRLDRLARSTRQLLEIAEQVKTKGATLRVLNLGDTGTATGQLVFTVIGAIAEFERRLMLERQKEAIAAAKDAGKLAIGMDSNQNPLFPGTVLTSLLKRVDNAVYDAFVAARAGTWQPGVKSLGLAERGVDYAMDDNNAALVTPEMREKAEAARAEIIAGRIRSAEP